MDGHIGGYMRKCDKKRIRRVKDQQKLARLTRKAVNSGNAGEVLGWTTPMWLEKLLKLKAADINFISNYKLPHTNPLSKKSAQEALAHISFEIAAQLEQV